MIKFDKVILSIAFCSMLTSFSWGDNIGIDDLVIRNNLFYKKFTDTPFTGTISGIQNGTFRSGERDGLWTFYYSNGQLEKKGKYKNSAKEGVWEIYWNNGRLFRKGRYKQGKKYGMWNDYHENGQLWDTGTYDSGKKVGFWEAYWMNGQLYSKGSYKDGMLNGEWLYFKIDGKLDIIFSGHYLDGVKIKDIDKT